MTEAEGRGGYSEPSEVLVDLKGDDPYNMNNKMVIRYDISIPRQGAITMKTAIFSIPAYITDPKPLLAIAAPTSPPTRVCEELEGSPRYQVIRFQMIAARTAAAIS